jgi:hypothetical protein
MIKSYKKQAAIDKLPFACLAGRQAIYFVKICFSIENK